MPLPMNIKELITNNVIESERIDFKEGWDPKSILHSTYAFANDFSNIGGGYIIVGVAEDQGQAIMPPAGIEAGKMDLTEGRSTGIHKMRFFLQRNRSPEPVFQTDEDHNYFLVTLYTL